MTIEQFEFALPTEIRFGDGTLDLLGDELSDRGYERPLIVTDAGIIKAGICGRIEKVLADAGLQYDVFSQVVPNPRDYDCDTGAKFAAEKKSDVLIAIGGGSAMDTAKAMATVLTNGKTTADWFDTDLDRQSAPVICIPTTCGTGSEVTYNAVITNSDTHLKANIFDTKCAPVLAIVDPDLIKGLPASLVASTGIDALTHAIEAYVATCSTPITDALAAYAIRLISENIVKAANEKNEEALGNVMLASMIAGIAFGNADTAAVHCIAECFGGFYDIPHGVTNSMFLADVSEASIKGNPKKYADAAVFMGADRSADDEKTALAGVEKIRELCRAVNIPKLSSFKVINKKDFDMLAQASSEHCCNESNPVEFTKEEYLQIFEKVYNA